MVNGDETWPLYSRCPDACDRLNVFQWEWIADSDHETRAWIRRKRKPVSQQRGVNAVGLLEACEEIAAVVQEELHTLPSPLTMDQAVELWHFRHGYLNALIYLGGHRLAKEVEAKVAPNGQPLAICLGSNRRHRVETVRGPMTMQGYWGCLGRSPTFPSGVGIDGPACARMRAATIQRQEQGDQ